MIKPMLKNLQKEIGIFLIALVVSIIMILVSQMYWETISTDKQNAKDSLSEAREKYHTALERKRLLKEFEDKYDLLMKQGIVGEEKRLDWIDVIEQTTRKEKIPYLKYKIEQQKPLADSQIKATYPGIDVFQSTMTLDMELLHEGDLYTVINNLQKNAKGLFEVSACNMRRNNVAVASILETNTDKNFSATCQLNWFTMKQQSLSTIVLSEEENE